MLTAVTQNGNMLDRGSVVRSVRGWDTITCKTPWINKNNACVSMSSTAVVQTDAQQSAKGVGCASHPEAPLPPIRCQTREKLARQKSKAGLPHGQRALWIGYHQNMLMFSVSPTLRVRGPCSTGTRQILVVHAHRQSRANGK